MIIRTSVLCAVLLGFMGIIATPISGQPFRTLGAVELAAGLRENVHDARYMQAVFIAMVRLWEDHPEELLDALADSVVEVAASYGRDTGLPGQRVRDGARGLLVSAAHWSLAKGRPYEGAAQRLVSLAYRTPERAAYLYVLGSVIERDELLAHAGAFATSDHRTAEVAVRWLEESGGAEGLGILRALYETGAVRDTLARRQLDAIARQHGWR